MKNALLATLVAMLATGCFPSNVKIELPPKGAPMADRAAAYKEYRPVTKTSITVDNNTSHYLTLANGEVVTDAHDLVPAVLPESDTARFAMSADDLAVPVAVTSYSGMGLFITGMTVGFVNGGTKESFSETLPLTLIISGVVTIGAAIFLDSWSSRNVSKAFDTYHADLMERLQLEPIDELVDTNVGDAADDEPEAAEGDGTSDDE